MKYVPIKVSGVIIGIGKTTDIPGYTETIIERMLPNEDELNEMTQNQQDDWVEKSNALMEDICKFMNDKNL